MAIQFLPISVTPKEFIVKTYQTDYFSSPMNLIESNKYLNVTLHLAIWGLFLILPPFLIDQFERIKDYSYFQYYVSFSFLILIFYLGKTLMKRRQTLAFIIVMTISYVMYMKGPIYISEALDITNTSSPIVTPSQRSKAELGYSILFMIALASNIMLYLFKVSKKLKEEHAKAELSLLKSQVNPHFLFNSLNTIYYLTLKKKDSAPEAVMSLSDMMRYVLTESNKEKVLLAKEIEYINEYLNLQKMRMPEKTKINYSVNIEDENINIAPLLLIPFIENAFKYGISANTFTSIDIKLSLEKKCLQLHVQNQIFQNEGEKINSTKNGIQNVSKRLELIYPKRHELSIEKIDHLFTVNLSIQL
ncbi:sensor histidine kinase [Aureibacter tunicatorum]|uniref:Sensor histidine kinase YesM n=1 Tax=Aureibacter tunicatorum TaxID=866807 RepID=A0AAE3XUA0_9BACT|nr:histidine kinase [Aureibacter tunicatorum]MDR6241819.1 sensor histidine kinase YesM [Aureibacter tunicatorum]BDD07066.1 sensor histidine kinase [Aureibacter tunicatorum]